MEPEVLFIDFTTARQYCRLQHSKTIHIQRKDLGI